MKYIHPELGREANTQDIICGLCKIENKNGGYPGNFYATDIELKALGFEPIEEPKKDDIVYERLAHVNYWYNGSYWVVLDPKYYGEPVMLLTDEAIAGLLKKVYAYEESPRTDIDISQVRKEEVHEQQESHHTSDGYRLAYSPVDTLGSNDVFYGSRNGVLGYWYR